MCLTTKSVRTAEVIKFLAYCAATLLIVSAISTRMADIDGDITDHDWIIDVTVLIESPDCTSGEFIVSYDYNALFGKYPNCREWFTGDSGMCDEKDEFNNLASSIARR